MTGNEDNMIEKICLVHNVPVNGERCPMEGCGARPIVAMKAPIPQLCWGELCKL